MNHVAGLEKKCPLVTLQGGRGQAVQLYYIAICNVVKLLSLPSFTLYSERGESIAILNKTSFFCTQNQKIAC